MRSYSVEIDSNKFKTVKAQGFLEAVRAAVSMPITSKLGWIFNEEHITVKEFCSNSNPQPVNIYNVYPLDQQEKLMLKEYKTL